MHAGELGSELIEVPAAWAFEMWGWLIRRVRDRAWAKVVRAG